MFKIYFTNTFLSYSEAAETVSSSFTEESAIDGLLGLGFNTLNTVSPTAAKTFWYVFREQNGNDEHRVSDSPYIGTTPPMISTSPSSAPTCTTTPVSASPLFSIKSFSNEKYPLIL